jgi:Ca-activated chloride channel family protein
MRRTLIAVVIASVLAGCAAAPIPVASPATPAASDPVAPEVSRSDAAIRATDGPSRSAGPWIGASGASDYILAGTSDTVLGVWVDVPAASHKARAPADVALVIDTSGSMAGPKMEAARVAARDLVEKLADGDIVSIVTFADVAREHVSPTVLDRSSRRHILSVIAGLEPSGSTNMFDGLRAAEANAQRGPNTHPVRRVVMISDGIANVGPSSPELLGQVAARGADVGVQVSAIGIGLDYDENTLNALAVRSSGRLYHLTEPREMQAILDREIGLLQATAATNAVVEVVPAPGVQITGADAVRLDWGPNGAVRVQLGTMFGGQHREMLLRVRVSAASDGSHPLASVRLRFQDPADGNLERVQEVVARYQVTSDRAVVASHANVKTQTIVASQEAAQITGAAAQNVNDGRFDKADQQLAEAEAKLRESAKRAASDLDRQRVLAQASRLSTVRAATKATAAAPPAAAAPAKRARSLEMNHAKMDAYGY